MKWVRFLGGCRDILYRNVFCILIFGVVFSLRMEAFGISGVQGIHLGMAFVSLVLINSFFLWKPGRILLPAGLVLVAGMEALLYGFTEIKEFCFSFAAWFVKPDTETEYLFVFQGIRMFFLAGICMLVAWGMEKWTVLRIILTGMAVGAGGLIVGKQLPLSKAGAVCLLLFILLNLLEWMEKSWKKERIEKNRRAYLVWLWPVWLGMAALLMFTPAKEEPYDWAFAKKIYEVVSREWTLFWQDVGGRKNDNFQQRMSGFSEQVEIGGNLSVNSQEVFSIKSQKPLMTNLYLAGVRMDDFQGRSWSRKRKESLKEQRLDAMETLYALTGSPKTQSQNFLVGTGIDVTFQYFKSRPYFIPLKLLSLRAENTSLLTAETQDGQLLEQEKGYGESYDVYYYQLPLGEEIFSELMEGGREESPELWDEIVKNYQLGEMTYDALLEYRNEMKAAYQSETRLSDGMKDWIAKATKDCNTGPERLRGIEQALQRLNYTLKPGSLPENVQTPEEFLDYFVLESGQGYCTYFATAFVLLARAEGYPARYAQGFCVPMKGKREVMVTREMAHAWPEVYFEGLGWIPFEPTPGYAGKRYTRWELMDYQRYHQTAVTEASVVAENELEQNGNIHRSEKRKLAFLMGGISFVLLLLTLFLLRLWLVRRSYRKKSLMEQYECQVERNLRVLEKLGIQRSPEETLEELGVRVAVLYQGWEVEPPAFLREYEEVLYGGREPDVVLLDRVLKEREPMLSHLSRWERFREWYDTRVKGA